MKSRKKLAFLLCGSFNPPTILHLRLFELIQDHYRHNDKYEVCGCIMSPVHDDYRKKGLVSSNHRYNMLKLAIQNNYSLICDDWEIKQEGWSRTRVVLETMHKRLNNGSFLNESCNPPCKKSKIDIKKSEDKWIKDLKNETNIGLKLICGADVLESFNVPGLWSDDDIEIILRDFGIIVISRHDINVSEFIYNNDLVYKYKYNIKIIPNWLGCDISSTKIRRAVGRGESVRYLIPDSVREYIETKKLYLSNL